MATRWSVTVLTVLRHFCRVPKCRVQPIVEYSRILSELAKCLFVNQVPASPVWRWSLQSPCQDPVVIFSRRHPTDMSQICQTPRYSASFRCYNSQKNMSNNIGIINWLYTLTEHYNSKYSILILTPRLILALVPLWLLGPVVRSILYSVFYCSSLKLVLQKRFLCGLMVDADIETREHSLSKIWCHVVPISVDDQGTSVPSEIVIDRLRGRRYRTSRRIASSLVLASSQVWRFRYDSYPATSQRRRRVVKPLAPPCIAVSWSVRYYFASATTHTTPTYAHSKHCRCTEASVYSPSSVD